MRFLIMYGKATLATFSLNRLIRNYTHASRTDEIDKELFLA